jgi:hypothetical protein
MEETEGRERARVMFLQSAGPGQNGAMELQQLHAYTYTS